MDVAAMLAQLRLRDDDGVVGRPRVLLNMISSADGHARLAGRSGGLSSAADRELLRGLRAGVDAVLVGAGTARTERYGRMLRDQTLRERRVAAGLAPEPLACIVSGSLALPADLPLLAAERAEVAILTASQGELPPGGATVSYVRCATPDGRVDLVQALATLRSDHGVRTLVCEGGPTLNAHLLGHGLVDELLLTVAPALVGGHDPLRIIAAGEDREPVWLELAYASALQSHVFLHYRLRADDARDRPAPADPRGTAP